MKNQNLLQLNADYAEKYGFHYPEEAVHRTKKDSGLTEEIVAEISQIKNEPQWMLEKRLQALKWFEKKSMPTWGADLSHINFENITYYLKPTEGQGRTWEEVPENIKKTFDRLGIPEAEKRFLGGVGAQYESESVYHKLQESLEKQGVVFLSMDDAVKQYPETVKKYFGTVVPMADNKFAALNTACWSGGSFIYVPKNVKVTKPLQAYFRINAKNMGQFERTLIIADEGSEVFYEEGCFTKGTIISTANGFKPIEQIQKGDAVLTHTGKYKKVYHTKVRPYTGKLYNISTYGNPMEPLEATEEHPFLCVKRERENERNKNWKTEWAEAGKLQHFDYLVTPINRRVKTQKIIHVQIQFRKQKTFIKVPSTKEFFRLAGYYLSEGSVDKRGCYLHFSFGEHEKTYINDVRRLLKKLFKIEKVYLSRHKKNHGISIVVSSAKLARVFEQLFSKGSANKRIPNGILLESPEKQKELILGLFRGDGNYYNKKTTAQGWLKEIFRINTTSLQMAKQVRDILLRLDVAAFINARDRKKEGRKTMYTIGITGEYLKQFGNIVGIKTKTRLNKKKRATMFYLDKNYLYSPIRKIQKRPVKTLPVYNFSVEGDESYVANGAAVHNCTAPIYSTDSLHAAVVELVALKNSKLRYTTIQNWSSNVYNLVTKRAHAYENATVEWIDLNLGSKATMKYPSVFLLEPRAKADILSIAFAGKGQHQDAGGKALHLAPNTTSRIISKSICKDGGRTSYRGLVEIVKGATSTASSVKCDALILDEKSRSDTYPTMKINEEDSTISHEAYVGKIGEEQLFYLRSRGFSESEATAMIVLGFIADVTKELPMEYALELNNLIRLEMEGGVG